MAATKLNHNILVTIYAYSISAGKNFIYQVLHLTYTQSDRTCKRPMTNFDFLLTVHLSIILVINQLNAQNLVL